MRAFLCVVDFEPSILNENSTDEQFKDTTWLLRVLRLSSGYQKHPASFQSLVKGDDPLLVLPQNHFFDAVFVTSKKKASKSFKEFLLLLAELVKNTRSKTLELYTYGVGSKGVNVAEISGLEVTLKVFDEAVLQECLKFIDAPLDVFEI